MRLFEAIVDANHRAVAGDPNAAVRVVDFENELPVVALTCVDPRLNALFPSALGLPGEEFIWLRNAGNIITSPTSSTMRSLALACAVKGGREVAIIGHTDCRVRQTSASELIERMRALGVERSQLPDNLSEFFGLFASERANVLKAVDFARQSPLIGSAIPVHGLMVDILNGRVEWLVNGYSAIGSARGSVGVGAAEQWSLPAFDLGRMKFPELKIGEVATGGDAGLPGAPPPPPPPVPAADEIVPPEAPRLKLKPEAPIPVPIPPRILRGHPRRRS